MEDRYYFTDSAGKILGPRPLREIRTFMDTGHIDPVSEVCREHSTDWEPVVKVLAAHPEAREPSETVSPVSDNVIASATAAAPAQAVATAPKAQGVLLSQLLGDLQERPVAVCLEKDGTWIPASIEMVHADFITLSLRGDDATTHIPLSRLRRIEE